MPPKRWLIPPQAHERAFDAIEKTFTDASASGFTGEITLNTKRSEIPSINAAGFRTVHLVYETEVGGKPAVYDGWRVIAAVDIDDTKGPENIRSSPGSDPISREDLLERFPPVAGDRLPDVVAPLDPVVKRTEDKREKGPPAFVEKFFLIEDSRNQRLRVPAAKLKAFLKLERQPIFFNQTEIEDKVDDALKEIEPPTMWSVETILAAAWSVLQVNDLLDEHQRISAIAQLINAPTDQTQKIKDTYQEFYDPSWLKAEEIRSWALSKGFDHTLPGWDDSELVLNAKGLVGRKFLTLKQIGLVSLLPKAYENYQAMLDRLQPEREIKNQFVGEPNLKVEVHGTITDIINNPQTGLIYVLLSDNLNRFKLVSPPSFLGANVLDHQSFLISGTILVHEEDNNGFRYTVLERCKVEDE